MKKEKKGEPTGFRPYPKTDERLKYARSLGFETAYVINEVLDQHLKGYLEKVIKEKAQVLQKASAGTVP